LKKTHKKKLYNESSIESNLPILLTSCVNVVDKSAVVLMEPEKRIAHTIESIEHWLKICPNSRIVICDSSSFDYSSLISKRFPSGKIESIAFEANKSMVRKYGKGFGEGEIIKHALRNSEFLLDSPDFIKCTAKLWVRNFDNCIRDWNGRFLCYGKFENVFSVKTTRLKYVDTRFYIASKEFYSSYLEDAHLQMIEGSGRGLEEMFLDVMERGKFQGFLFTNPPVIAGVGGGAGAYYKTGRVRIMKDALRWWLLKKTPDVQSLFSN
jgi:hypothetical protein